MSASRRCVLLIEVARLSPPCPDDLILSFLEALIALHNALERSLSAYSCRIAPSVGEEIVVLTNLAMSDEAEMLALLRVAKDLTATANALTVSWKDEAGSKRTANLPIRCLVSCGAVYEAYTSDGSKGV
jgi:hypothetical protein